MKYWIQSGILQKKQQCLSSRSDIYMINSDDLIDWFCWIVDMSFLPQSSPLHQKGQYPPQQKNIPTFLFSHSVAQLQHSIHFPCNQARIFLPEDSEKYICCNQTLYNFRLAYQPPSAWWTRKDHGARQIPHWVEEIQQQILNKIPQQILNKIK